MALAGNFALQLADLVAKTKWEAKGLRPELNLRIALHAGPVYEFDDPITGDRSYSGTHVSRAARLEPITPPGQVYATKRLPRLPPLSTRPILPVTALDKLPWQKVTERCRCITSGRL